MGSVNEEDRTEPHRETVYCSKCDRRRFIVKQRDKFAKLDCLHQAVYEDDTATWDVI